MPRVNGQPIIEILRCACRVRVQSSESGIGPLGEKKIAFRDKGGLARRLRAVQRQVVRQKFGLSATSIIVLVLALDARPLCFSVALVAISYYNPTSVWEKRARLRRRLRRELGDQLLNQKTLKKPVAPLYSAQKPSSDRRRTRAAPRGAAHTRITAV